MVAIAMKTHYIVATEYRYWGRGDTLEAAIVNAFKNCSRESSRRTCAVSAFRIDQPAVDEAPFIDSAGRIVYSANGTKHRILEGTRREAEELAKLL